MQFKEFFLGQNLLDALLKTDLTEIKRQGAVEVLPRFFG
jgi:hypothetical protein